MSGRLLIVDDDRGYCDSLDAMFRSDNPDWTIRNVYSILTAVETIETQEPFDIILTRLKLSDGNGSLSVVRAAREKDLHTEIVLMTDGEDLADVCDALEHGASQFVDKGLRNSEKILHDNVKKIISEVVENRMWRVLEYRKIQRGLERRGKIIYEREIRDQVEPMEQGKYVVLDVATGAYEIDENSSVAAHRLLERLPDAELYGLRIGDPAPDTQKDLALKGRG